MIWPPPPDPLLPEAALCRALLEAWEQRAAFGHARRTKDQLESMTGLDERSIRRSAEVLRALGWPVISSSSNRTPGYWLTRDPREVDAFLKREVESRLHKLLRQRRGLRTGAGLLRKYNAQEAEAPASTTAGQAALFDLPVATPPSRRH